MERNIWEKRYNKLKNLWGIEPEGTLVQYEDLIPEGKILEIGIGEGRNVIRFALNGYEIKGIDLSKTAIKRCENILKETECNYNLYCGDIIDHKIKKKEYSLIISTWVFNFLKKTEVFKIIKNMQKGIIKGGILYIGVFSKKDPNYYYLKENKNEVEKDTFYLNEKDLYVSYYDLDEILDLFGEEYELICKKEGYSLDYGHGDKHYHGDIEIMVRKR